MARGNLMDGPIQQPHHDPAPQTPGATTVTMLEHVTSLMAALDARFTSLLTAADKGFVVQHADLKTAIALQFEAIEMQIRDADLRYQQRFDAQTNALDAALAAQKEAVTTALTAAEKATSKAEVAADKRFESVNEFRAQLGDQAATFMPRSEGEQRLNSLAEKIADMKTSLDITQGQTAGSQVDRRLQEVAELVQSQGNRLASQGGRGAGLQAGWVYLLGALGAVGTLVSMILVLKSS